MSGTLKEIRTLVAQLTRFGVSGVINTIVYIGTGKALLAAGVGHAATGALALLVASATGYVLHKLFSFRSKNEPAGEAARFGLLVLLNATLSSAALPALARQVGMSDTLALMTVSLILPVTNFLAMKFWIFKSRQTGQEVEKVAKGSYRDDEQNTVVTECRCR